MSQYLDKDGASRIAENFLSKQAEQDAILQNLQFDLKEAEHALVKTIQGPAPLNIRALTRPLDDYLISGNMIQNGTPTPSAPIYPEGCGVRTTNLFDKNTIISDNYVTTGGENSSTNYYCSDYIPVSEGAYYLANIAGSNFQQGYVVYDSNKQSIRQGTTSGAKAASGVVNISTNEYYIRINIHIETSPDVVMVNSGSTALPYEPYGYKLPLTIGGTEYPIYLGQVKTTRRIRKLVLKGDENWSTKQTGEYTNFSLSLEANGIRTQEEKSTHFRCIRITEAGNTDVGFCIIASGLELRIRPENVSTTSLNDFKAYLSAQYANGTPVTVWYVLAEPETGIVNEPLHKIGDYADTISMTQAGVEISTTKGFNAITTDTTALPSNIEVKGVINNA